MRVDILIIISLASNFHFFCFSLSHARTSWFCSFHPAVISWAGPRACLACASHGPPHQCTHAHGRGQMPLLLQAVILAVGTPHMKIFSSQETFQNYTPVKWEQVRKNFFAQCFADRSSTVSNETNTLEIEPETVADNKKSFLDTT